MKITRHITQLAAISLLSTLPILYAGCGQSSPSTDQTMQDSTAVMDSYSQLPTYTGNDLGITFQGQNIQFKVWAPTADELILRLYEQGLDGKAQQEISMELGEKGEWKAMTDLTAKGKYYTYQTRHGETWSKEVADPYAVAVGANGRRAMVLDISEATPENWDQDKGIRPANFADIILYEMHVRDLTVDEKSGIQHKGKFLGVAETGTRLVGNNAQKTGLDALKELGITHVHLLPSFDHQSIDETRLDTAQYNWGYDPLNYNVPEGSYSTDPNNGAVRVMEFRQMVKTLHDNGIGVILDVVYNHTGSTEESIFNQIEPGYYYRHNPDGSFSDASGCGNETASERAMMRQYMVQSVVHWVKNYHVDGFRFDLMGIHDIETMNAIRKALDEIDPNIFLYGEGWTAGGSPLDENQRAVKRNVHQMPGIAAFCDEMRDGIKGHWSNKEDRGFATGKKGMVESIQFGIVGATQHPDIDFAKVNYSQTPWAKEPTQCINYVECHDDLCLRDKIEVSAPDIKDVATIQRLALGMVLTAQGIPFLHSGTEYFRTKQHDHNSYKSGDEINKIRWEWATTPNGKATYSYVKGMIQMRKDHPAFRLKTAEEVRKRLHFIPRTDSLELAYQINAEGLGDHWKQVLVMINANDQPTQMDLPEGTWMVGANEKGYSPESTKLAGNRYSFAPKSVTVLYTK